jgi:hypothetical protein
MNARLLLTALVLFTSSVLAADPPKGEEDPIAAQLLKDKEAFVAAQDRAKEEVLKAFDKLYESVKSNKSMKLETQLAQLEKIEAEKKAFEDSGVPPTLAGMKVAMSEYRTAQKKAEVACRAAFEKAGKAYRDKGDVKTAGATLEEMKEFLAKAPSSSGAGAAVAILCGHTNKVLGVTEKSAEEGAKLMIAEYAKGDLTQLWRVVAAGDGYIYFENVKSGLVLTAGGKKDGAEITLAKKHTPASDDQLWKLSPVPNTKDAQKVFAKGSGKLWAVEARGTDAGTRVLLWHDVNGKLETAHTFGLFPPK